MEDFNIIYNAWIDFTCTRIGMTEVSTSLHMDFISWLVERYPDAKDVYSIRDPYCGHKTNALFQTVTKCGNPECKSLLYIFERDRKTITYRVRNPEWWSHFENVVKKI